MADQPVTREKLINADKDVENLGKAVNEEAVVTPRYGNPYKSAPLTIKELQQKADQVVAQGFYQGYATEALLLAAKPAVAEMRARADDTRKIWRWNRTSAEGVTPVTGTWTDTGLSDLEQAKGYTDQSVSALNRAVGFDKNSVLFYLVDKFNTIVAYIDSNGVLKELSDIKLSNGLSISGLESRLSDQEDRLNHVADDYVFIVYDAFGKSALYIKSDGSLYIPNMNKSVQDALGALENGRIFQNNLFVASMEYTQPQKERISSFLKAGKKPQISVNQLVATHNGLTGYKNNRIPSLMVTSENTAVMFFNKGIVGFDGDNFGADLFKTMLTWDEQYNITKTETLFKQSPTLGGTVKHPNLGRLADGRLILMTDENNNNDKIEYKQHIYYSSDEGQTWTDGTEIVFNSPLVEYMIINGTGGRIITLASGRLVMSFYYPNNRQVLAYSDDNGQTWTFSNVVDIRSMGYAPSETAIVENSKGEILVFARDDSTLKPEKKHLFKSTDSGVTLEYVGLKDIQCPPCQASVTKLSDGTLILATPTATTERTNFQLHVSFDDGDTWDFIKYRPYERETYGGYSSIDSIGDILITAVEGAKTPALVNYTENMGLIITNLSEVLKNGFSS